jgi:predicted AlkP superfamily pyrophosphatase or phosphodiesterase
MHPRHRPAPVAFTPALVAALAIAVAVLVPARAANDVPRVLLVSIDGLMPVRYTDPPSDGGAGARIPVLRHLMTEGVWADSVIGVTPTLTYPSHTTLVSGVPPAVHGIYDNRILDPEGVSNIAWYWYARDIKVQTLATAAHSRGLRAAAVSWPVSVGLDIDYNVPEFWRSAHPETITLLRALSTPRDIIDAAEIAQGHPFGFPQTDRQRTDMAKFMIRTYQPEMMLVHLFDTDSASHAFGPGSEQARAALERVDGYIGELLETLKNAGLLAATHVVIASDHGFLATSKQLQLNAAFLKAGLLTVNDRGTITSWQAYFHPSGGMGFIYLNTQDPAVRDRVWALLQQLALDPANGIRKVYSREELDKAASHPDAMFAVDMADGFYTGLGTDTLIAPTKDKGGHGFDPDRPALRASFIFAGPTVARRGSIGTIRMTQIAPTLARILGVGLSPLADQGLTINRLETRDKK